MPSGVLDYVRELLVKCYVILPLHLRLRVLWNYLFN